MPTILITKINTKLPPEDQPGVYIGRTHLGWLASPLANPYSVKEHGRFQAITLYREWLAKQVDQQAPEVIAELKSIRNKANAPGGVTLLCWCAPYMCHGEVIREAVITWAF